MNLEAQLRQFLESLKVVLTGSELNYLLIQFALITGYSFMMLYFLIHRGRGLAVVLSYTRINISELICCLLNLGLYHLILVLLPEDRTWKIVVVVVVYLLLTFWRIFVLHPVTYAVAGQSIKDLKQGLEVPFNYNWPLIPRVASFCFSTFYLIAFSTTVFYSPAT
jgi:hypothetical protein